MPEESKKSECRWMTLLGLRDKIDTFVAEHPEMMYWGVGCEYHQGKGDVAFFVEDDRTGKVTGRFPLFSNFEGEFDFPVWTIFQLTDAERKMVAEIAKGMKPGTVKRLSPETLTGLLKIEHDDHPEEK